MYLCHGCGNLEQYHALGLYELFTQRKRRDIAYQKYKRQRQQPSSLRDRRLAGVGSSVGSAPWIFPVGRDIAFLYLTHDDNLTAPGILGVFGTVLPNPVAKIRCFTLNVRSVSLPRLMVTFQYFEMGSWFVWDTTEDVQTLSSSASA